jgi:hypothetical protein
LVLGDIGRGLLAAYLRQASAPGVEPLQSVGDGALRTLIRFRLADAYLVGICLMRVSMIRIRLTRVPLVRVRLIGILRMHILRIHVLCSRVGLICVSLGRICLVPASGTRVSLGGVCLGDVVPDDIGVLSAGARLVARADISGVIAGVRREAARGSIAVIGPIPGAAQFGHASVCP